VCLCRKTRRTALLTMTRERRKRKNATAKILKREKFTCAQNHVAAKRDDACLELQETNLDKDSREAEDDELEKHWDGNTNLEGNALLVLHQEDQ
jgi:hypothetical protein